MLVLEGVNPNVRVFEPYRGILHNIIFSAKQVDSNRKKVLNPLNRVLAYTGSLPCYGGN